jgi:predicted dehydrogenase
VFGANDRVGIGVIGVGNRGKLLIDQLPEQGQVVAVADCFLQRCHEAAAKRQAAWRAHQDYRRLLDDKSVDAVIVSTTDHGRVLPCIHACQAGKDVYAEKPLTLYLEEGRVLVRAVRKYRRVFQVGSQQRSMAMNRMACEFVRTGGIGKVKLVQGFGYPGPEPAPALAAEPVPDTLDWDVWLGQTPLRPYNATLHRSWMRWREFSGGEMTNWGAHGIDQIQSALGMDGTGPVEFWPLDSGIAFRYASGIEVRLELTDQRLLGGAVFTGEKGVMEIVRNNFRTDPPRMVTELPPPAEVQKWRDEVALWQARYHMEDWLNCIRSRKDPVAPVEVGHRSLSIAHLANITRQLNRRLRWDPVQERFESDDEANRLLSRPRRQAYKLPSI